jgi:hypothetical protein
MRRAPAADPSRPRTGVRLTPRDLELLAFIALHRIVLPEHVAELLEVSEATATKRLLALQRAGYLTKGRVFDRQPTFLQTSRPGLDVIGSRLPVPKFDVRAYKHDVGVAWLWLAARSGSLGAVREVISERQLRSHDTSADGHVRPLAVRLGGTGRNGRDRLHYPDLLLVTVGGKRIALELELTGKGRFRREKILSGYAADARIDGVVYLVENASMARAIAGSARTLGISDRVRVQYVRYAKPIPPRQMSMSAARVREAARPHTECRRAPVVAL